MRVDNFDQLGDYDARVHRIGDVELPGRGVLVRTLMYGFASLALIGALGAIPVTGWLVGWIPPLVRLLVVPVGVAALCSVPTPGGLPLHKHVAPIARYLATATYIHGWRACAPFETSWQPPNLPVAPNGSEVGFRNLVYRGPGRIARVRRAKLVLYRPTIAQRLLNRSWLPVRTYIEKEGARPGGPQVLDVPADVSVEFAAGERR